MNTKRCSNILLGEEKVDAADIDDKKLSFIFSLVVLSLYILNLSSGLSSLININVSTFSDVLKIIMGVFFFIRINIVLHRFNRLSLWIIITTVLVILINIMLFPQNNTYFINYTIDFIVIDLPLMLYATAINDYKHLVNSVTKISYVIALISILFFIWSILSLKGNFNGGRYDMGFSYACLLPCMIMWKEFLDTKKLLYALLFICLVIIIIAYGSRGPLLCILTYFFYKLFRKYFYKQRKLHRVALAAFLAVLIFILYKPTLELLGDTFKRNNIDSRTIELLVQDQIHLSGRDEIYQIVWHTFIDQPFMVRGINADYLLTGYYSHNIFLELLYEFGIIIGVPLIFLIVYLIIKNVFYSKSTHLHEFVDIVFSISLPALMISGSVWGDMYFWIWFVLSIKSKEEQKTNLVIINTVKTSKYEVELAKNC